MEEGPEVGAIVAGTVLFLTNYSAAYVIFCIVVCVIQYTIRIVQYDIVKNSILYQRIVSTYELYDIMCVSYELYCIVQLYVLYDT